MESSRTVSEASGFPTLTVLGAAGSAALISTAYLAIYHYGEQLAAAASASKFAALAPVLQKAAPFLPPQAWALGITLTAVALATLYIAYSIKQYLPVLNAQMREKKFEAQLTLFHQRIGANGDEQLAQVYERFVRPHTGIINLMDYRSNPTYQKDICRKIGQNKLVHEWEKLKNEQGEEKLQPITDRLFPNGVEEMFPANRIVVDPDIALAWGVYEVERMAEAIYNNDPANGADQARFKTMVDWEALQGFVKDLNVPRELTALKLRFTGKLPVRDIMNVLSGKVDIKIPNLIRDQLQKINFRDSITRDGAKEICLGFAKEIILMETVIMEKDAQKNHLEQFFVKQTDDNFDTTIENEANVLEKGLEMYGKIIAALEEANNSDLAQKFKERVYYEELKGLVQETAPADSTQSKSEIKDKWPVTDEEKERVFKGVSSLNKTYSKISSADNSDKKGLCLKLAREAVLTAWENIYKFVDDKGKAYLEQYFTNVQVNPLVPSNLEGKEGPLLRKGMCFYENILDAMRTAGCPKSADEVAAHIGYDELEKELAESKK